MSESENSQPVSSPTQPAELKEFLLSMRDKLADHSAPVLAAAAAMNHLMNLPNIYQLLDNENKELARDVWLRIKQAGVHVKNPPLLFGNEGEG